MKLYYSPGACSLSPNIVFREAGIPFALERVDLKSRKLADGGDFTKVNGKGSVPVLELDDGRRLTEGPAIVQYIADRRPESRLAPTAATFERYQLQEWLNFISTEIHKQFSPLFSPSASKDWKETVRGSLTRRFDWLEAGLGSNVYLMGDTFTVADAYLYTVLRWASPNGLDLARWPRLARYFAAINERPRVQEALKAEGLVK